MPSPSGYRWLAAEFEQINVWSAGYDSAAFAGAFAGEGSSLIDHATILLDFLISKSLGVRPTIFITHSLGGLIVKQMLRKCCDSAKPEHKCLLEMAKAIVFIGTPHQGAGIASVICTVLNKLASKHIQQLAVGDENLLDLNEWFRTWAGTAGVNVAAYYETKKTFGVLLVPRATANPNVFGCVPTAIDSDHVALCKPSTHESQLYLSIKALIANQLPTSTDPIALLLPTLASAEPQISGTGTALAQPSVSPPVATGVAFLSNGQQRRLSAPPETSVGTDLTSTPPLPPELLADYEFFTTLAPDDRRPLDKKLEDADRLNEVTAAQRKKERFAMSLRRYSAQASSLVRYVRLLSDVESRFNRHVRPLIDAGVATTEINRILQQDVIDPVLKAQLMETGDVTPSLIESALYYLTGNCHVRWDANKV